MLNNKNKILTHAYFAGGGCKRLIISPLWGSVSNLKAAAL